MMPGNRFSTEPVVGRFLFPDDRAFSAFEDWEMGGIAHQDGSQGINLKPWRAWIDRETEDIYVQPVDQSQPPLFIVNAPGGSYVSLAFDRNMRVTVAWRQLNIVYLYWYDATQESYITSEYEGARTPRLTHDDKRSRVPDYDDVVLFYLKEDRIYCRNQRERYLIETPVGIVDLDQSIYRAGMTDKLRVQVEVR